MDIMLLKTGEVMTFTEEMENSSIVQLLGAHDGVEYFWKYNGRWYSIKVADAGRGAIRPEEDVPAIVKLTLLLE